MSLSLSSLRAVSMMMGTAENSRMRIQAVSPSTSGIIRSRMMRSKLSLLASSTAAAPSKAVST